MQNLTQQQKSYQEHGEAEELKRQILQNIYQTNEQTNEVMVKLDNQGQRIDKQGDNFHEMGTQLNSIEYMQKNIKSVWGQFKGLFRGPKEVTKDPVVKQPEQQQTRKLDQFTTEEIMQMKGQLSKSERDDMLDEINRQVSELKKKQQTIGVTLQQQNATLDKQVTMAGKQVKQMEKIQTTGDKIIKK